MDIKFVAPDLRRLDETNVELCACTLWSDVRPLCGLAGLIDWRLAGRVSSLLRSGFVHGDEGEALLVPGKPQVPFEKVLLLGLGARTGFGDGTFRRGVTRVARALERLRVRRAVVELPGRSGGAIDPESAIAITLECLGSSPDHDAWWLVEPPADQKRIEARAADERRRARAL